MRSLNDLKLVTLDSLIINRYYRLSTKNISWVFQFKGYSEDRINIISGESICLSSGRYYSNEGPLCSLIYVVEGTLGSISLNEFRRYKQ